PVQRGTFGDPELVGDVLDAIGQEFLGLTGDEYHPAKGAFVTQRGGELADLLGVADVGHTCLYPMRGPSTLRGTRRPPFRVCPTALAVAGWSRRSAFIDDRRQHRPRRPQVRPPMGVAVTGGLGALVPR